MTPFRFGFFPSWAMNDVSSFPVEGVGLGSGGSAASCSTRGVCGRGSMEIFGATSLPLCVFFISSRGISSDLGRGILGLPSLERVFELSRLFAPLRFCSVINRTGLSQSLLRDVVASASDGVESRRGAANPGPRLVLNNGRFSLDPRPPTARFAYTPPLAYAGLGGPACPGISNNLAICCIFFCRALIRPCNENNIKHPPINETSKKNICI